MQKSFRAKSCTGAKSHDLVINDLAEIGTMLARMSCPTRGNLDKVDD